MVPLLLAVFLVAPAGPAHACSCAESRPVEAVGRVDMVLRGTLVGAEDPGASLPLLDSGRLVTHELAVAEVYKGAASVTTFVRSAADGASCGVEVEKGREYVLFARQVGNELRAELCDGTALADRALVAELEEVTGPGRPPGAADRTGTTPVGTARPSRAGFVLPLTVGLGGLLVATAFTVAWWRRRTSGATGD